MKTICISYPSSELEDNRVEIPAGADPWVYCKQLAVNEAETEFVEHSWAGGCQLEFYPDNLKIVLYYPRDNTCCVYQVEKG